MAYIIGKSISLNGTHEVINQITVREARFNKELEEAIHSIYPEQTEAHKKAIAEVKEKSDKGLKDYRSVHIAGKYFFKSKKHDARIVKHIKD